MVSECETRSFRSLESALSVPESWKWDSPSNAGDYGYKASVAKAYEGYRKEAARLDPIFEARLFSSALTRLEEPPLRLVQDKIHGSPWQELVGSEEFTKALGMIPELRDRFLAIAEKGVSTAKDLRVKKEAATSGPETITGNP